MNQPQQQRGRRSDGGFTLIEVMLAILLTAVAVIGILALYMTETKAAGFSRHSTEATALGTDKLEKLRTSTAPTVTTTGSETGIDPRGQTGGIFTRSWTATPYAPSGTTLFINLDITVSWDENGVTRSVIVHGRRGT